MSFDALLRSKFSELRRSLLESISDVCRLSRVGAAQGYRHKRKGSQRWGYCAIARLDNGILFVDYRVSSTPRDWLVIDVASAQQREIMLIKGLHWYPMMKYHPLEALGNVFDD